jgi:hypothetical protein
MSARIGLPLAALLCGFVFGGAVHADPRTPLLKWQYGGCTSSCQTGWYSSPALVDLDGDGTAEVVAGSYDLVVLNGASAAVAHRNASASRIWTDIAVADLNHDGYPSIAIGRNNGTASVLDPGLIARGGWPVTPFPSREVRALALGDLDANGTYQVVVAAARSGSSGQVTVYTPNGAQRAGWPRPQVGDPGSAAGIYNDDIAITDLAGVGYPQIFVPTDVHYILGLNRDGSSIAASALFGSGKVWAQVGVHVNQSDDIRGYADCGATGHGLRPNFAASAPAVADMDGDGRLELALVGNVYDCTLGQPAGDRYHLPWLFEADRTRFDSSGYDWTAVPAPSAGSILLSEGNYALIEDAQPNAVVADIDGDGKKEILYASYDGKLHAYWLDKTEHGNWPFAVPGLGIHFASPPVVADLYHDGHTQVIFATWPQATSIETGKLYILDALGNVLQSVDLPAPKGDTWNGGMASPTLGWLPGSRNLFAVLMTHASGAVAYELPQTPYARTLWPTGRGSYLRNGSAFNERIFADGLGD